MTTKIENAIDDLSEQARTDTDAGDAMRRAQAALNLAHVLQVLAQTKSTNR